MAAIISRKGLNNIDTASELGGETIRETINELGDRTGPVKNVTVNPGSNTSKNVDSNVTHNLNASLSELIIKLLISTDGTDNNSFLAETFVNPTLVAGNYGYTYYPATLTTTL